MQDFKQFSKRTFPRIFSMLHEVRMGCYRLIGMVSPRLLIRIWYSNVHHETINLDNPQTLDEKINWLKLNGDISMWTRCADKYLVRDYVKEKGLGFTLNTLYGVYERAEDIDFEALPDSFVLKTNNGGGGKNVLIVKDKSKLDKSDARKKLAKWLKSKPWLMYYEPQYKDMSPKIIAEKYLEPNNGETSLVDIKINCINGKAYSVFLCSDREPGKSVHYSVYDLNWTIHPEKVKPEYRTEKIYPRPSSFEKMIAFSECLSKGIPYVRVDWYEINGSPVFSEMTFTPAGGFQGFYTMDYLNEMGEKLTL